MSKIKLEEWMEENRLSVKLYNAMLTLERNGIKYLEDISREIFLEIRFVGEKTWNEFLRKRIGIIDDPLESGFYKRTATQITEFDVFIESELGRLNIKKEDVEKSIKALNDVKFAILNINGKSKII